MERCDSHSHVIHIHANAYLRFQGGTMLIVSLIVVNSKYQTSVKWEALIPYVGMINN